MKREIKFRAWDNISDRMFNDCFELTTKGFVRWIQLNKASNNLEWMQYTGLKDKKGKEIYESDIVTWPHLSDNCKYVVYYNEDEAHYFAKPIKHCEGSSMESYLDSQKMVKIGNIHENPELLK